MEIYKNTDDLHFDWGKPLSYNKIWNFAIGQRESGKSVNSWMKLYNAYYFENRPSLVLRRRIADITPAYIEDTETLLNKFLVKPIQLLYMKGDIKNGIVDVKVGDAGVEYSWQQTKKLPVFFRVIGLSNPMNRIKSLMLNDVKYIFMDEFIVNLRANEKYLTGDEKFLIQEIYTTFNREASTPIKILCCANPYSVYCPLFTGLNVDTAKLKPGAFVVGPDYVIDCFQASDKLKAKILAQNPLYEFDDSYARYGFNGESVNDTNIKIQKFEPKGFKLKFIFKLGNDFITVHQGTPDSMGIQKENFWVCKHKPGWYEKVGRKRKIVVFDFRDMCDGSFLLNSEIMMNTASLRQAISKRNITYNCIEASYMMEDVYRCL